MMDWTQISIAGLGVGFSVLGWFARELWNAVQQLKSDLGKLEVKIGTDYVRYDRLQDALKPLIDKLSRIEDAVAHKQDR